MPERAVLSVAQYLDLVNDRLREAAAFEFDIEGEVSDFRVTQGKWVSFDLKDEEAQAVLKCFMTTWQLTTALADGMRVRVTGAAKVSPRFGKFQLDVRSVEPVGVGALKQAYEALKKKLDEEGLFDAARKRPIPRFPERIGLITSRDAAAYGDFLRIVNNRWAGAEILFTHVHVQGREAVGEIIEAFQTLNRLPADARPDLIVLIRGGGGLEDLMAFNDESVARAVYGSTMPVVCGVGHERDESLCDFVADVRASTPSNAAERVVPSREDVGYEIIMTERLLEDRMREMIERKRRPIERLSASAELLVQGQTLRLTQVAGNFNASFSRFLPRVSERLSASERVLRSVNPERVLERGYSIVRSGQKIVRKAGGLDIGAEVSVQLAEGSFDAEVIKVGGKGKQRLL